MTAIRRDPAGSRGRARQPVEPGAVGVPEQHQLGAVAADDLAQPGGVRQLLARLGRSG